jgi:hypothetical protein
LLLFMCTNDSGAARPLQCCKEFRGRPSRLLTPWRGGRTFPP